MRSIIETKAKHAYHVFKKGNPIGYVFMLHRVGYRDENRLDPNENMKVSPDFLSDFLENVYEKFDFVSVDEIPNVLRKGETAKPFIAFTMDDGYKDNYYNALPVFKKYDVPYTIFVATDFPEMQANLWWYEVEDIVINTDLLTLPNGLSYDCSSKDLKNKAFMDLRATILGFEQEKLTERLDTMFGKTIDWSSQCKQMCMSWEDIRKCKDEPLVTIGAHTNHHFNLSKLSSEDAVKNEIEYGRTLLRDKAGIITTVFAYPFGTSNEVGSREISIVESMGFQCAFKSCGGYCGTRSYKNMYELPRIMLSESEKDIFT